MSISRPFSALVLSVLMISLPLDASPAHAGGGGGRPSIRQRVRARISRVRSGIGRRVSNVKTWFKNSNNRKKLKRGALLIGGGVLAGAVLANPVGAAAVVSGVIKAAASAAPSLLVGGGIGAAIARAAMGKPKQRASGPGAQVSGDHAAPVEQTAPVIVDNTAVNDTHHTTPKKSATNTPLLALPAHEPTRPVIAPLEVGHDASATHSALQQAGLVSAEGRWTGGTKRVALTGARRSVEALTLARSLEREAKQSGGRVHSVMGANEPLLVAAALSLGELRPVERRQMTKHQRGLERIIKAEPALFRALLAGGGTMEDAVAQAQSRGLSGKLTSQQKRLLRGAIPPLAAALRIMDKHGSKGLWSSYLASKGSYKDALALHGKPELLRWVQKRPLMIQQGLPSELGSSVLSANRTARRLMQSKEGAFALALQLLSPQPQPQPQHAAQ